MNTLRFQGKTGWYFLRGFCQAFWNKLTEKACEFVKVTARRYIKTSTPLLRKNEQNLVLPCLIVSLALTLNYFFVPIFMLSFFLCPFSFAYSRSGYFLLTFWNKRHLQMRALFMPSLRGPRHKSDKGPEKTLQAESLSFILKRHSGKCGKTLQPNDNMKSCFWWDNGFWGERSHWEHWTWTTIPYYQLPFIDLMSLKHKQNKQLQSGFHNSFGELGAKTTLKLKAAMPSK